MTNNKIIIIVVLIGILTVCATNYGDCKWIYRCCKKIRDTCVKNCEPEIICPKEEIETEQPVAAFYNVIGVDCKAGFRANGIGKCKRIL